VNKFFLLPKHLVSIPVILLFGLIYFATVSYWAVIAYLVVITVILWFIWMNKRKAKKTTNSAEVN